MSPETTAAIERAVAEAPPLSVSQRDVLATLFGRGASAPVAIAA